MKCNACRRTKFEFLNAYGGSLICDYCLDIYNPKTRTVELLSESSVKRLKEEESNLKRRLREIEYQLKINNELIATNQQKITFKIHR